MSDAAFAESLEAGTTIFVLGEGGGLFKMDVPTGAMARELFNARIAKGDVAVLADDTVDTIVDGDSVTYVRRAPAAPDPDDTPPVESKSDLFARATAMGLNPAKSWSVAKLTEAIAAAEAPPATELDRDELEARARDLFDDDELEEAIDAMSDEQLAEAIAAAEAAAG